MIITRLHGGLGNQLFQYACGRALALRNGDELKLDISSYQEHIPGNTPRQFNLANFSIVEKLASPEEIKNLRYPYGIFSKLERLTRIKIMRNFNIHFNPRIFTKKENVYLDGYWQTEQYFKDQEAVIRKDFAPKTKLENAAGAMLAKIQSDPMAVSIHIRRGDYFSDPKTQKKLGMCDMEYYLNALNLLAGKISSKNQTPATLYFFSDDIDWVQKNFHSNFPIIYVSCPAITDWQEIILMSACRHHIIANSTFSWWGAWLNPRPDKIVITPKRWAIKNNHMYRDLIPSSWIRL